MAEPIDKDTRGPVNLRIKFRSESLQQFIERYGVDVSRGGIFIRTREPLPVGTRLKLDFQLVDTAPLFQGDGTVVWIREHDATRAGVTPGMGVRFDRLTPESQTTLDTILEEKIRLQQSGVAPGSIAKAGAGIAVRRPSGAFATLESPGGATRPGGPPPLPVAVKPSAPPVGAAPQSPMPASATRSGPLVSSVSSSSSSIFTRPRTTSGMRAVPVPSQLFEAPTADDIDKALSALEEKGDGPPSLPVVPTVINREDSRAIGEDDPTRVFDGSVAEEFAAHDAITGRASVVPEDDGIPVDTTETGDGELTERRLVDPASGTVSPGGAQNGMTGGKAAKSQTPAMGAPSKPAPPLDAPLASLVDSGAAPPAKPPTPALSKPSAPAAAAPVGKSSSGIPMKISTDRPAATESGRFRSDARYKRKRGNGLTYALLILVAGGGVAGGGYYFKRQRDKRAAEAIAAAAAAPPVAPAQLDAPTPTPAPAGTETAPGAGGAAATPPEKTGAAPEAAGKPAAKPEEAVAKTDIKPDKAAPAEKQNVGKPAEKATAATEKEGQPAPKRKKDRGASAPTAVAEKPAEAAGEKKPTGDEPKPAGDTAKTDTAKPAEGDKGDKGDKVDRSAEAAKPAEAAPAAPPVLKITSSPTGAEVVIDGVPVGTTPFSSKEISADATHAITVKKDGFESHERMISGSDWGRGKGGAQSLKFNVKLKKMGGEAKPAEAGEKKEKPPEVEILTPSEP